MKSNHSTHESPHHRRGIYLIPNLITIAAMFAGFYAIIAAMRGADNAAAIAILIALIFDGLDGRIARLLHAESDFGVQLDSLSDMLSFGITPALVMYSWSLTVLGKLGWLAAFIYTACTGLRLARFNTQSQQPNKRYFQGLPTPAAAALIASTLWLCHTYDIPGEQIALPLTIMAVILAFLKVSRIRYHSFKDINLKNRVPFTIILMAVLILAFIAFDPPDILFGIFFIYVISGPCNTFWSLRHYRRTIENKKNSHE